MLRKVVQMPLDRLWDENGDIEASRERWLSKSSLTELLRKHRVEFVIADIGHPLRRVDIAKCYDFWKSDVKAHLVDDPESGFYREDFPDEFAYIASEWSGEIQTTIVLLEKQH